MNWPRHKWVLAPLLPFAWLYRGVVALRNFAYARNIFPCTHVPATVVSLGNLSVGGSGKTPATIFLANALAERGVKVAIVARGYGRTGSGVCIVSDGHSVLAEIHEAGDEPLLLAQQCPHATVIVAESKTRAAQIAVERFQPHVLLVDDGFQHRRLQRALDLVLVSARMLLHKPWLLPAGPLREPLHNLERANWILLTEFHELSLEEQQKIFAFCRSHTTAKILPIAFRGDNIRPMFEGKNLATLQRQNAPALLVSGIAFPERFRKTAEASGVSVRDHLIYRDHQRYTEKDIALLMRKFQNAQADYLLTTAKDAVKLRHFTRLQDLPFYVLDIRLDASVTGVTELVNAILASPRASAHALPSASHGLEINA